MSDKFTQDNGDGSLDQFLANAPNNTQALLLSAYLKEKKKWEQEVKDTTLNKIKHIKIMSSINFDIETTKLDIENAEFDDASKSGVVKFYNKLFGVKTKSQKLIVKLKKEIEDLQLQYAMAEEELLQASNKFSDLAQRPPSTDRWELAMMGNKLFSPRQ